jgi:hypothetical protein
MFTIVKLKEEYIISTSLLSSNANQFDKTNSKASSKWHQRASIMVDNDTNLTPPM